MTVNEAIAYTTLIGVVTITVADAPEWELDSYIGLLAAMTGVSVISRGSPELAKGLAGLIAAVLVLQRGADAIDTITAYSTN